MTLRVWKKNHAYLSVHKSFVFYAAMTVGKDVSSLFPDVVNCMQTEDMELKKLVYLYLINYAKTQPDLAIMAVNTFVKDSQDPNPLIRALAVRTMGCIRVDRITEYLCDPLQRCLKDDDPYVRKTAAVCVAKLHDINAELVEDRGFLDTLKDLISDANPMVVANAVAALSEIQDVSSKPVFTIDQSSLTKMLRALNECTEWGQVFILDAIAAYEAADSTEAESVVERVIPRLQHANAAVVLSAVKVVLKNLPLLQDTDEVALLRRKLAPPLVTLLSLEPEIQYVALRCINLVVQKSPEILAHEVRVFFCKYNDPIYVKIEKLDIMVRLASEESVDQVLLEFKEYAAEVDVDFVRRSVRAIGKCAVAIEAAAERCVNVLLDLIRTRGNYVVQEAVVVIKDIFRRYPNRYESVISTLCDCLESLDEAEARAAMVWIIGEYAERIDNADELLEQFLDSFPEEPAEVQLQLVTASVKLFLKKPTERPQQLIQLVLTYATQETDNPDLRDRAFIYWRLLSSDPEVAKDIVLAEKPVIGDSREGLEPELLTELLGELGALSSVYHRCANTFVSKSRVEVHRAKDLERKRAEAEEAAGIEDNPVTSSSIGEKSQEVPGSAPSQPPMDLLGDLLDLGSPDTSPTTAAPAGGAGVSHSVVDLMDLTNNTISSEPPIGAPEKAPSQEDLPELINIERGKGLAVNGKLKRLENDIYYLIRFQNSSNAALDGFMIQFNKNIFGLAPANQVVDAPTIPPGGKAEVKVPVMINPALIAQSSSSTPSNLQVALKTNQLGVLYFEDQIPLLAVVSTDGRIDGATFVAQWKAIPESEEQTKYIPVTINDVEATIKKFEAVHMFVLAHKTVNQEQVFYITSKVSGPNAINIQLLLELRFVLGQEGVRAFFRSQQGGIAPLMFEAATYVLTTGL